MGEIARITTDSIGPGMMIVFLLGALAATFSTAFNYFGPHLPSLFGELVFVD